HLLTEAQVEAAVAGTLHDGGGLVLIVRGSARSWFFRYNGRKLDGKRGDRLSLGSARTITLEQARRKAGACRNLLSRGVNPKTYYEGRRKAKIRHEAKAEGAARTLGQAIDEYFEFAQRERLWKSDNTIGTNESAKKYLDTAGHRSRPLQHIK